MQRGLIKKHRETNFNTLGDVIEYLVSFPKKISYVYIERKEVRPDKDAVWICDLPIGSKKECDELYRENFKASLFQVTTSFIQPFFNKFSCNNNVRLKVGTNGIIEEDVRVEMNYPINSYWKQKNVRSYHTSNNLLDIQFIHKILQEQKMYLSKIDYLDVQAKDKMIDRLTIHQSFQKSDLSTLKQLLSENIPSPFINDARRQQIIEKWVHTFKILKRIYLVNKDQQIIRLTKNNDSLALIIDGVISKKRYF